MSCINIKNVRFYLRMTKERQLIYAFVDHNWLHSTLILVRCWPLARLKRLLREANKKIYIYCAVNCQISNHDIYPSVR
jgi:hypothetical protein